MAETLNNDQKAELVVLLIEKIKTRELTISERLEVFDLMTVDLGAVLPGYSDRRDDWYNDDPV